MKSQTKDILKMYGFAAMCWAPLSVALFPAALIWMAKAGFGWMLFLACTGAVVMLFAAVALCAWLFIRLAATALSWMFGIQSPEDVGDYE